MLRGKYIDLLATMRKQPINLGICKDFVVYEKRQQRCNLYHVGIIDGNTATNHGDNSDHDADDAEN